MEIKYTAKLEEFEVTTEAHRTELRPTYYIQRFKINFFGFKVYKSTVVNVRSIKDVNLYLENMTGVNPELKD